MRSISAFFESNAVLGSKKAQIGCWAKDEANNILFYHTQKIKVEHCNDAPFVALFKTLKLLKKTLGISKKSNDFTKERFAVTLFCSFKNVVDQINAKKCAKQTAHLKKARTLKDLHNFHVEELTGQVINVAKVLAEVTMDPPQKKVSNLTSSSDAEQLRKTLIISFPEFISSQFKTEWADLARLFILYPFASYKSSGEPDLGKYLTNVFDAPARFHPFELGILNLRFLYTYVDIKMVKEIIRIKGQTSKESLIESPTVIESDLKLV